MKICIVGCGNEGSVIAGLLAKEEEVEELILASLHEERAKLAMERVKSLGTKVRVRAKQVDGTRREDVASLGKGMDIVFNASLPVTNIPIMQACLDVGAHYLDMLSYPFKLPGVPPLETLDAQLELDDKFKAAGLTALTNVGVGPGFTDLASRYIIDQLDSVDTVIIRWADWCDSKELITGFEPSVTVGMWFSLPGSLIWDNGEVKEIDLLGSKEDYEWPEPIGTVSLYNGCIDTELRTIPEFVGKATGKAIKHVEMKGGLRIGRWNTDEVWIEAVRKQVSRNPGTVTVDLFQLFGSSFIAPVGFREAYDKGIVTDGALAISVEVTGKQGGQQVRHTIYDFITLSEAMKHLPWAQHMSYMTVGGVPIVTILMIGSGEITKRGVIGAGSLDNYREILRRVVSRGHQINEEIKRPAAF